MVHIWCVLFLYVVISILFLSFFDVFHVRQFHGTCPGLPRHFQRTSTLAFYFCPGVKKQRTHITTMRPGRLASYRITHWKIGLVQTKLAYSGTGMGRAFKQYQFLGQARLSTHLKYIRLCILGHKST